MTDAAAADGQATAEQAALATEAAVRGAAASPHAYGSTPDERPELAVGAAFAGGLVLALFLKRLAR